MAKGRLSHSLAAACAVALAAVLVLGVGCSAGSAAKDGEAGASAGASTTLEVNDRGVKGTPGVYGASDVLDTMRSTGKLAGAVETTDDNGVVHGVKNGIAYTVHGRGQTSLSGLGSVTLVACGDQIGTDNSYPIARRYGSRVGADYDFTPFYQEVAPFVQEFDLRYINQETVMAGGQVSGYPIFNAPDAAADALHNVGYNLVNFTTNHTYDMGTEGIERSHEVFAQYPEIIVGGSYLSQEARDTVQLIERNGVTFAFLAYTYGDNMYGDPSNMPNSYYSCVFDKDTAAEEIDRAQQVADVVIVSMHWGSEYTTEPNSYQLDWADFLVEQDVDLVLGTHAHSLQPTKLYESPSGKTVPVVFGLSDFVTGWTLTDTIISGLFTCEFVQMGDGTVKLANPVFYPSIEWSDGGDVYVRRLCDMSEDEINANTRTEDVYDDYEHINSFIDDMGIDIPVIK